MFTYVANKHELDKLYADFSEDTTMDNFSIKDTTDQPVFIDLKKPAVSFRGDPMKHADMVVGGTWGEIYRTLDAHELEELADACRDFAMQIRASDPAQMIEPPRLPQAHRQAAE